MCDQRMAGSPGEPNARSQRVWGGLRSELWGEIGMGGKDLRRRLMQWDMVVGVERVILKNALRTPCSGGTASWICCQGGIET
jgi:hypothetical protein